METPPGFKRTVGLGITLLAIVLPYFGLGLSEAAPVEIARFADGAFAVFGLCMTLYGEYHAKSTMWFAKVNKA